MERRERSSQPRMITLIVLVLLLLSLIGPYMSYAVNKKGFSKEIKISETAEKQIASNSRKPAWVILFPKAYYGELKCERPEKVMTKYYYTTFPHYCPVELSEQRSRLRDIFD